MNRGEVERAHRKFTQAIEKVIEENVIWIPTKVEHSVSRLEATVFFKNRAPIRVVAKLTTARGDGEMTND